jgi:hypothetical protein
VSVLLKGARAGRGVGLLRFKVDSSDSSDLPRSTVNAPVPWLFLAEALLPVGIVPSSFLRNAGASAWLTGKRIQGRR